MNALKVPVMHPSLSFLGAQILEHLPLVFVESQNPSLLSPHISAHTSQDWHRGVFLYDWGPILQTLGQMSPIDYYT